MQLKLVCQTQTQQDWYLENCWGKANQSSSLLFLTKVPLIHYYGWSNQMIIWHDSPHTDKFLLRHWHQQSSTQREETWPQTLATTNQIREKDIGPINGNRINQLADKKRTFIPVQERRVTSSKHAQIIKGLTIEKHVHLSICSCCSPLHTGACFQCFMKNNLISQPPTIYMLQNAEQANNMIRSLQ